MLYQIYEFNHAFLAPWRTAAAYWEFFLSSPFNPLAATQSGKQLSASLRMFRQLTKRFSKPSFNLEETVIDGRRVAIEEEEVLQKTFCTLLRFRRLGAEEITANQPKLLMVAPMSGHYATLLRGTVRAMLPFYDIYVTGWSDARDVPLMQGRFGLDEYIDYVIEILQYIGPEVHVMAVCQPAVPVLAAAALMAEDKDPMRPRSLTLMGGPIDTRINPTEVNLFAKQHSLTWFKKTLISQVPFPYAGFMRPVYPGFVQLSGFLGMNFNRHVRAHWDYFRHLVAGDGDSIDAHKKFYDEYLAVMDMTAEFYLDCVHRVFHEHLLPRGLFMHRERPVRPQAIEDIPILTVEGEHDDISGIGQTQAAHSLCRNLPAEFHDHYLAIDVGHYGVFNGSRWRDKTAPRVRNFIARYSPGSRDSIPPETRDNVIRLKS
jgi:poly(3-hydroxybutyrate) depolymerase